MRRTIISAVFAILIATSGKVLAADGKYYYAPATNYYDLVYTTQMWVPNGVAVIRGVIIFGNPAGGNSKNDTRDLMWQAFARCHGFALMGTHGFSDYMNTELPYLDAALTWYASAMGQPSFTNAPIVFTGHSNGGQMAYDFNALAPTRVIAFSANKGGFYENINASATAEKTPGMIFAGARDLDYRIEGTMELFDVNRPTGALWSWAIEEGVGHALGNTWGVLITFFDHAIRARYPLGMTPLNGPVTLLDLNETSGWLCNKPGITNGLTGSMYSYTNYPGAPRQACWLLDEDVANLYRGLATYKPILSYSSVLSVSNGISVITNLFDHHQAITITCTDTWMNVANVYDGALKLGTITKGGPTSISVMLPSGGHGIVLHGYDAQGNERTSIPMPVVVKYYDGLDVFGNGLLISSGDVDPRSLDGTQMQTVDVSAGPVKQVFKISNRTLGKTVNLTNSPNRVTIQGGNGHFKVSQDAGKGSLAPDEFTTFEVEFDPSQAGDFSATVSIRLNDPLSTNYSFTIQGTGTGTGVALITAQGTPYTWIERYYGTNATHETIDSSDTDGDGMAAWQEYMAGTDPTDKSSYFTVVSINAYGLSNSVSWLGSDSGSTSPFTMKRSTDLVTWTVVEPAIPKSSSGTNIWWDVAPPSANAIFYRPCVTN